MVRARRPPNRIAEIGTPWASSQWDDSAGLLVAGAVKRALGWAAGVPRSGLQGRPCQSISPAGGVPSIPSHQTPPSAVRATFVKMVSRATLAMALGFVLLLVPG